MSPSSTPKRRVSSGLQELDRLMGDLYIGDNVLWYEDAGSFSAAFCLAFTKETIARKKPIIYVTFDRSPKNVVSFLGSLAESQNLTILDCFTNGKGGRSQVFKKFYEKDGALWPYQVISVNDPSTPDHVAEAIYALHSNLAGDVHFIIDSLTGMQSLWGSEEQVITFYTRTCPRLYELDTIAYWLIEKQAHSKRLKAHINKIAQVAIDLSVRRGKSALKILKAEKRNSRFLNEHHEFVTDGSDIVFESERGEKSRFDLGARIRSMRLKRDLSQKELARLTGVTPSTISQIEKNLIYPSLPALFRIADSLSADMTEFFKPHSAFPRNLIHPAAARTPLPLSRQVRERAKAELLISPDRTPPIEFTAIKISPGQKLNTHFYSHKGREIGLLLSGRLEMSIDNQIFQLDPGDTVYLVEDTPESWTNLSDHEAELLWIKC